MVDWDFWRWFATTVVAVGALLLSIVNTSRTWKYNAHWTVEVGEKTVRIYNRTGEDATMVALQTVQTDIPHYSPMGLEVQSEPLVAADGVFLFEVTPERPWYTSGSRWEIVWTRPRTRRVYLQSFGDRDSRPLRRRLQEGLKAVTKPRVSGRRIR
jgi:hypothetical protein